MNVLVLGSGGREHALSWKIAQSPLLKQLFIAPGNSGTAALGTNVDMSAADFAAVTKFIKEFAIDLLVVGPEDPLVNGIHNFIRQEKSLDNVIIVGPQAEGARLEGSKEFAKEFMERYHIPTARYSSFTHDELAEGIDYLASMKPPYVLKADGLAAGKGVVILPDLDEAIAEFEAMLDGKFGKASTKVVIEEFLSGIELSVFVLCDGESYHLLPEAKDYKRIGEGDTGLNTGGMGAVSPVPFADEEFMKKVIDRVVEPTMTGLKDKGIKYEGFIFFGLINVGGDPFVIEYNVRMGDPESEVVIPRIKTDLLELMSKMGTPSFGEAAVEFDERAATTVMLVSGGYPESYEKGKEISGLDTVDDSLIFHSGAKHTGEKVVSSGGRVLAITSLAGEWSEALKISYKNAGKVSFDKMYYRRDIGFDL
ncbi:MAG: phosphoribosylamine--glycine ligase [Bacteroidales bacterium]|nr:phosphoribosylamine--glycine ligase [Bacteroidales bacterium]